MGCATMQPDKTVILEPCQYPVPSKQKVNHDLSTKQLIFDGGYCVTADSGDIPGASKIKPETIILGRPLAPLKPAGKKSYAILMLNNKQNTTLITCNQTCLG